MYIENLDHRLEGYLKESATPQILELITRRILDSGYNLSVDIKKQEFADEIRIILGSSLHKFHKYIDSCIETWVKIW
jgi:hypothetical protein